MNGTITQCVFELKMLKLNETQFSEQCGNLVILLPLRFYVKSASVSLELQSQLF